MSEFIIEKIEEFANTLLPSMGLELVEVQFRREGHGWVLRLFIDCETGITVDHCADVSREVSDFLDVEDLIEHQYHLEVSSPGLERPLKTVRDYERFVGRKAKIKLRESVDGEKVYVGEIQSVQDESVELVVKEKGVVVLPFEHIRKARLAL
ncbi:ribosome maturation factor RimP [Desulfopila aestuarii]|uniref:Ribosome maturation factor RimP n=1 Tax=Desulfopila aestuarii DSM 18488 TaxID=1121416 RepID=A0A1M7Y8B8_9BACT|nr:ribosome maturation factor RimP [Desulfopila aestuarii]SHO48884.1 ribosome maturation factor RimP [Desulfopila aestuarii DSM 18488]